MPRTSRRNFNSKQLTLLQLPNSSTESSKQTQKPTSKEPVRTLLIKDSSAFDQVEYDLQQHTLRIHFTGTDSVWEYDDVPQSIFAALASTRSPGYIFNRFIRNQFAAKRISPPAENVLELPFE